MQCVGNFGNRVAGTKTNSVKWKIDNKPPYRPRNPIGHKQMFYKASYKLQMIST